MFLLVPAHPGCPGQNPESREMVVCLCVFCRPTYSGALQTLLDNMGYDIVMTEEELNGPERFAADNVLNEEQCQRLMRLANVSCTAAAVSFCQNYLHLGDKRLLSRYSFHLSIRPLSLFQTEV